jgi:hypothetical protein
MVANSQKWGVELLVRLISLFDVRKLTTSPKRSARSRNQLERLKLRLASLRVEEVDHRASHDKENVFFSPTREAKFCLLLAQVYRVRLDCQISVA